MILERHGVAIAALYANRRTATQHGSWWHPAKHTRGEGDSRIMGVVFFSDVQSGGTTAAYRPPVADHFWPEPKMPAKSLGTIEHSALGGGKGHFPAWKGHMVNSGFQDPKTSWNQKKQGWPQIAPKITIKHGKEGQRRNSSIVAKEVHKKYVCGHPSGAMMGSGHMLRALPYLTTETRHSDTYPSRLNFGYISDTCQRVPGLCLEAFPKGTP